MDSTHKRMLPKLATAGAIIVTTAVFSAPAAAQEPAASPASGIDEVRVTARRREESAQDVPIPVSVVRGDLIADAGAFNVNRVKELIPTVQLYSSNPRNTAINIRGLGTTFGLTNDGIEAGVGFYLDGVYFARPAATTLDFIDVEQLEVLRGPQGTLFGKNTTAGAIIVTTRKPSFTPDASFELGYGNEDFVQAKGSFTGPLGDKVAGRISFSATERDGQLYNVATQESINNLDNPGFRAQLLMTPSDRTRSPSRSTTRASVRTATRKFSRASRPRCGRLIGNSRRSSPISATRLRAAIRSTESSIKTRRGAPTKISAALR